MSYSVQEDDTPVRSDNETDNLEIPSSSTSSKHNRSSVTSKVHSKPVIPIVSIEMPD